MLEREEQGYATTNALLALAAGLGPAPGRKSLMFFAEGLAIPDAVLPRFRDVVTTANRGNVSVYTIDAAGLRVHSKDAETGRAVRGMGAAGLALNPDGTSRRSLDMMEYNEDVLRKDPRTSLTLLAEQTGGFLVENTNELAKGVGQIQMDRRSYVIYPNMGEPIRRTLQKTLPFYIVVLPGSGPKPSATVEIVKDGHTVAQAPARLGAADVSGRIQHVAQIPIENLPPGPYTLRMTLTQGDRREVCESSFTLTE